MKKWAIERIKNKYFLAGALSIKNAIATITALLVVFLFQRSGIRTDYVQAAWSLVSAAIITFVLLMLRKLLNENYDYHNADKTIIIIISGHIAVGALLILHSYGKVDNLLTILLAAGNITVSILQVVFAVQLLRVPDDLFGLKKPLCVSMMVCGSLMASVILIPAGQIASMATDVIMGMLLIKAADRTRIRMARIMEMQGRSA